MLPSDQEMDQIWQSIEMNQEILLKGLQIMIDLFRSMADMSNILYDSQQTFPPGIYKSFRSAFESSESLTRTLQKYQSSSQDFHIQKEQIIDEHLKLMNHIISFQQGKGERREEKLPNSNNSTANSDQLARVSYLENQILALNHLLESNNEDFHREIQNYNNHLYQLKQTIQNYEVELQKTEQMEMIIDDLENKLLIMREEKERDSMVIDNMARKIRFFERERGGREAFFSPRGIQASLSPETTKGLAVARSNISAYRKNP